MRILLASSVLVSVIIIGCEADLPDYSAANHDPTPTAAERRETDAVVGARDGASDLALRDAIEDELLHDPATNAQAIDVHVEDGAVTLTGEADDSLAHQRAIALARQVRGVREVVDDLTVTENVASR